jgi:hypothetical protein
MRRGVQRRMNMRASEEAILRKLNRWGRPPGLRPTPSSAILDRIKKPARGPAADQGVRPTIFEGVSMRQPEGRATFTAVLPR